MMVKKLQNDKVVESYNIYNVPTLNKLVDAIDKQFNNKNIYVKRSSRWGSIAIVRYNDINNTCFVLSL